MKPHITEHVLYDSSVIVRRVAAALRDMGLPEPDEPIWPEPCNSRLDTEGRVSSDAPRAREAEL
jgi:hypothetical protein